MKNRFWRYGTKVKKWDDRLLTRSVIFCMLLSLLLSAFLLGNAKVSDFGGESPLLSRIAAILLFGAMLCVSAVAVLGRQRKVREYLENREALARMIIDNGWYETDVKANGRGEQDLTTYVPRVGLFLLWQKKLTELIAFCIVAVIAVGLVWNPYGAKDALLNVFNSVFGVSGGTAAGVLPMLQPHLLPDAVLYLLC